MNRSHHIEGYTGMISLPVGIATLLLPYKPEWVATLGAVTAAVSAICFFWAMAALLMEEFDIPIQQSRLLALGFVGGGGSIGLYLAPWFITGGWWPMPWVSAGCLAVALSGLTVTWLDSYWPKRGREGET